MQSNKPYQPITKMTSNQEKMEKANSPKYMEMPNVKHTIDKMQTQVTVLRKEKKINPNTGQPEEIEVQKKAFLEWQVGAFACTIAKQVFQDTCWIITPEKSDPFTNKRPDLTIDKINQDGTCKLHAIYEVKRVQGDYMGSAVKQSLISFTETMDNQGTKSGIYECYIIAQRGLDIAFFEYHNDLTNLDEEEIPHFRGCVSMTYHGENQIEILDAPAKAKPLSHDMVNSRPEAEDAIQLYHDAKNYEIPCVLNLLEHPREIEFLFHHIATNAPRSSI